MKKLIPLMLMLAVTIGAFAEGHALKVSFTDGSSATYALSEKPKVSFSGQDMTITSSDASTSYPRSEIVKITFEEITTSITDVNDANNITYSFNNDIFEAEGTEISVYSTSGSLVTKGSDMVSLRSLQSGVYVVRAGKQSIKIRKK
ncbi:MAG: hypothetical protein Q4D41_08090 [Prevotellaceae bacterium]|nr:hypothetical protein [Prevotellaceae bacterium]